MVKDITKINKIQSQSNTKRERR